MEELSARLRRLRFERRLTQAEVGAAIGVHKQAIQKYESGRVVNIRRENLCRLASFFGVSLSELLDDDALPEKPIYSLDEPLLPESASLAGIASDFCIKMPDAALEGIGIKQGDTVFLSHAKPENGDIAAVSLNLSGAEKLEASRGTALFLRKFYRTESGTVLLLSENPDYPPLVLSPERFAEVTVSGKAVAFTAVL